VGIAVVGNTDSGALVIGILGAGSVVLEPGAECDPLPFLRTRKSRKYMGLQDDLAVVAAGRALADAGGPQLGERAGLYLAVGYIPFADADIAPVLAASLGDNGGFDVRKFGAGGYQKAHPLLTFRCLPNMPAYHVSACFDVQGPYYVTYPGPSAFYSALESAVAALDAGEIEIALVGAVAAQSNFLVRHHFARLTPPLDADDLRDVAAILVLSRDGQRGTLDALNLAYAPPSLTQYAQPASAQGPARLAIELATRLAEKRSGAFEDRLIAPDGVTATSKWSLG
jgi:hypothetical protein